MPMRAVPVQVEVISGSPVSLGYAVIEAGSLVSRDGLIEGRDYTVDYSSLTVTFSERVRIPIASFILRADLPDLPQPQPQPDYGDDAADIARQVAEAVVALRAFIALTPPTQAQVVANAKLQNRVLLALLRRLAP